MNWNWRFAGSRTNARMESLLVASWPKALREDTRVTDQYRRVLDSMAKLQGIAQSVSERLLPQRLDDDDDDDEDGLDDLRRRRDRESKYG